MKKISREIRFCKCGCGKSKEVKVTDVWRFFRGHNNIGKNWGNTGFDPKNRISKICPVCGKAFWNYISTQTTHCSSKCYGINKKGTPLTDKQIEGYKNRKTLIPWNKGLTKSTDSRLLNNSLNRRGKNNPMYNHITSEETKAKLRKARLGFKCSDATKEKMSLASAKRVVNGIGGNKYYKRGHVFLERLNMKAFYRSSYEKCALLLLDKIQDVTNVSVESIYIEYKDKKGKKHRYIPDYLVTTADDLNYIIEVKATWNVNTPVNILKFTAAREYAKKHNMLFTIWTEDILFSDNSVTTTLVEVIQSATAAIPLEGMMI